MSSSDRITQSKSEPAGLSPPTKHGKGESHPAGKPNK